MQVLAHNLARWMARLGLGEQIVTTKTLRRRFFSIAGRLTHSARRLTLHLPKRWPWETQFSRALARLRALPFPACRRRWRRPSTRLPNRLADSRTVAPRAPLAACCPDHLAQHRHRGPPTSPLRGYRTLHPAISVGSSPHRLFPFLLIPCLTDMATSLRWIRV